MDAKQSHNIEHLVASFRDGSFGEPLQDIVSDLMPDPRATTISDEFGASLIERCENRLLMILSPTANEEEIIKVKLAIEVAKREHKDTPRDEGLPYVIHPLRVALILAGEAGIVDPDTICAAILHDIFEDTKYSFEDLKKDFGERVALCVDALTEKKGDTPDSILIKAKQAQALGADVIRIADRIDNIRSIVHKRELGKRIDKLEETEIFYVPFSRWQNIRLSAILHTVLLNAYEKVRQEELYEDEIRTNLKGFFFSIHERVANLPVFKNVTQTGVKFEDYAEYLKVGYGIFSSLEDSVLKSPYLENFPSLWNESDNRSPLLLKDLERIGVHQRRWLLQDRIFNAPNPEELSGFLSALYVLRGARLGGVTVRGKVEQELGLSPHKGAAFLNSFGDGKATFKKFEEYLEVVKSLVAEGEITIDDLGRALGNLFTEIERYSEEIESIN